jgi:hypothetical protein
MTCRHRPIARRAARSLRRATRAIFGHLVTRRLVSGESAPLAAVPRTNHVAGGSIPRLPVRPRLGGCVAGRPSEPSPGDVTQPPVAQRTSMSPGVAVRIEASIARILVAISGNCPASIGTIASTSHAPAPSEP